MLKEDIGGQMLKKLVAAVIISGFSAFEAYAASGGYAMRKCSEEYKANPPEIEILYNYGDLKFDNSQSTEELKKLLLQNYPKVSSKRLNGLTQFMPYVFIESSANRMIIGDSACYYPKHVRVVVGYKPTVYIRNDIQPGSCRFNVTLRHEQTHLDIAHLSLKRFAQKVKRVFPQMVKDIGFKFVPYKSDVNGNETSAKINEAYKTQLNTLFNGFVEEMTEQQMRIDTAENYKEETALCPND